MLRRFTRLIGPSARIIPSRQASVGLARIFPSRLASVGLAGSLWTTATQYQNLQISKRLLNTTFDKTKPLDLPTYDYVCNETLESLCEYFEQAVEDCPHLKDPDVVLGDGVLNIQFGAPHGSYVINRQRPNLQIWLSSPTSGPKRYDFVDGRWIYKHDGVCLHDLLEKETSAILQSTVDLSACAFYRV